MQFQIEVRPRPPAVRAFIAWLTVEAGTEQVAIVEAMRRFREQNPDKDVAACEFRVVRP